MSTKTILLIDHELNVREIVELCLNDLAGWNVVIADSPSEALQKAALEHPDAIVMDLSMHCLDSLKFMNKLRNHPETQAIPVVVLSAKARWIDSQILQRYQIAGTIHKPFNPLMLPIQIATLLGWDLKLISNEELQA